MNKSHKWSIFSSVLLLVCLLLQMLSLHISRSGATPTSSSSSSTSARDVGIITALGRATSAEVFRSDAAHPELITLSAAQKQQLISRLRFMAPNCVPSTFSTSKRAKKKSVCFCFNSPAGDALIMLDLDGGADFYGDKPNKGPQTVAFLCPESGTALRDLLMQDPKFKSVLIPLT